jgi:beta-1,3-N-acetylglucosaminyltransferase 5/beta-1,3-galactosyltransferase 1
MFSYCAIIVPTVMVFSMVGHWIRIHTISSQQSRPENFKLIGDANTSFIQTQVSCDGDTYMILVVISAPGNYKRRRSIRETWMQHIKPHHKLKAVFIIGNSVVDQKTIDARIIVMENKRYKDIIMTDYPDTYVKLTYKVLAGYW